MDSGEQIISLNADTLFEPGSVVKTAVTALTLVGCTSGGSDAGSTRVVVGLLVGCFVEQQFGVGGDVDIGVLAVGCRG